MKKFLAMMLVLLMLAAFATAAFARTCAVWVWNEEAQRYEIIVYDDGTDDMGVCRNQDQQNQDDEQEPPTLPSYYHIP